MVRQRHACARRRVVTACRYELAAPAAALAGAHECGRGGPHRGPECGEQQPAKRRGTLGNHCAGRGQRQSTGRRVRQRVVAVPAARYVQHKLGFADGACVAAGNSENDLPMLEAGFPFIMVANAVDNVAKALGAIERSDLHFRAASTHASGVVEGLEHFFGVGWTRISVEVPATVRPWIVDVRQGIGSRNSVQRKPCAVSYMLVAAAHCHSVLRVR